MTGPLTPADLQVVREALDEIQSEPPPRNFAGVGCVMALPGFVLLLVFPMLARLFSLSSELAVPVLVLGGVLLVVGLALWFGAGGLVRGRAIAAAEAALRTLESDEDDRGVLLRAATLLLWNAYAAHGPSTTTTFDFNEGRRRLGPRLEAVVLGVEEHLLGEGVIYPVFTLGEEGAPPEDEP